jgi:hypothetical protein
VNASFPVVITEAATEADANDAILNGTADANGGETEYFFEYGLTGSYGSVVMGEELGSNREISEAAIDLPPETTYHYRLVADSPAGIAYGDDQTVTTLKRTMSVEEEEELTSAEDSMDLIAAERGNRPRQLLRDDVVREPPKNVEPEYLRGGKKNPGRRCCALNRVISPK